MRVYAQWVFPSGDTFRIGYRQVWFDDVATDSLERVQAEFDAALREQSNKGIDPTRMRDIMRAAETEDAGGLRTTLCVVSLPCSKALHLR